MEKRQLQIFLKVCEMRSITKAAERLFITQQAVSRTIANLEDELNARLFIRTPQGVELTDCGEELEHEALEFLQHHDNIVRRISNRGGKKEYKIGFFFGMLQMFPPHFLTNLMDEYPNIEFRLQSYMDNEQSRLFQNHDCDLVMSTSPLSYSNFIEIFHCENQIGVIMEQTHTLTRKGKLVMADLKGQRLINLNSDNRTQTRLRERLEENELTCYALLSDAEWGLTWDLLRRGYVSFFAGKRSALPEDIVWLPLADLDLVWEFFIYKRRGNRFLSLEEKIVEIIEENVRV